MSSGGSRSLEGVLLRVLLRGLSATWRIREEIPPECAPLVRGEVRAVIAFWHGKMLPVWYRFRGARSCALVSASRDGGLLAEYLSDGLGYGRVVRGSSSRKGGEALSELVDALGRMSCLITPDGPRGPARRAKAGALVAAARAGVPVMLAGWECRSRRRLGSWDAMEIPYPFAKVYIRYCIFDPSEHVGALRTEAPEAMSEAVPQGATDAGAEAVPEGMSEARSGDVAEGDAGAEAMSEALSEAVPDGAADAGAEAVPEGAADAGADAVPEGMSGARSGDVPEAVPDGAADTGAGDPAAGRFWVGPDLLARFEAELDRLNHASTSEEL